MCNYCDTDTRPVLIVSTKVDIATDAVVRVLRQRATPLIRLNTEDFPYRNEATFRLESNAKDCEVVLPDGCAPFRSVWWRRLRASEKPEKMNRGVHEYCSREARDFIAGTILASDCRIMSAPSKVWAAEHKLYQLVAARACGIEVPDTVVTNDADEIRRAFDAFEGEMIAKPVRTGFVDLEDKQCAIYTTQLYPEHLEDLSDAKWSPTIFQRLVSKDRDVRITVVGDRVFAAAIDSRSDPSALIDWRRTQDPDIPHSVLCLPESLESKIILLMKRLGLAFGALDFVLTPEGRYVFLEVNPSGQWLWLDDRLDLGITSAVADWLSAK